MTGTPENKKQGPLEYDPEQHDGLLYHDGRRILVSDAEMAKLHELPLAARKTIAQETTAQMALIIDIADEERVSINKSGYLKGIELLKLP